MKSASKILKYGSFLVVIILIICMFAFRTADPEMNLDLEIARLHSAVQKVDPVATLQLNKASPLIPPPASLSRTLRKRFKRNIHLGLGMPDEYSCRTEYSLPNGNTMVMAIDIAFGRIYAVTVVGSSNELSVVRKSIESKGEYLFPVFYETTPKK
jgi:hypothetical protein